MTLMKCGSGPLLNFINQTCLPSMSLMLLKETIISKYTTMDYISFIHSKYY
jgi:hypothetical protein